MKHVLGSCTHSEVRKVYISRHDEAMRLIMKEIQNGSHGNFYVYCTATGNGCGIGRTTSKRLPEWPITTNTMHACDFSPKNKEKLHPDCMIGEITRDEIDRALKNRSHEDTNAPTQINGRPRKMAYRVGVLL
jgi:hypothetical protein